MTDINKMAVEAFERIVYPAGDTDANECDMRNKHTICSLVSAVTEAVLDEAISRVPYGGDSDMSDFCLGRRVGFGNAQSVLNALKREICGKEKKS